MRTHTVQIILNLNGACVYTCGVNHTCVGYLDSTCMYTHMFLHMCMFVWLYTSQLTNQLFTFQFKLQCYHFRYSVLSLQGLGYTPRGTRRNHGGSRTKRPNTSASYLMEAFQFSEVIVYYTKCSAKPHHRHMCKQHKCYSFYVQL